MTQPCLLIGTMSCAISQSTPSYDSDDQAIDMDVVIEHILVDHEGRHSRNGALHATVKFLTVLAILLQPFATSLRPSHRTLHLLLQLEFWLLEEGAEREVGNPLALSLVGGPFFCRVQALREHYRRRYRTWKYDIPLLLAVVCLRLAVRR
jgi:hypothetical protein